MSNKCEPVRMIILKPAKRPQMVTPGCGSLHDALGGTDHMTWFDLPECRAYWLENGKGPASAIFSELVRRRNHWESVGGTVVLVPLKFISDPVSVLPVEIVDEIWSIFHKQGGVMERMERVNHPLHYGGDTVYEAIKVIEAWELGFNLGNTVKYISRAGKKSADEELTDLEKAAWYLARHIANLKKKKENKDG